MRQQSLEQLRIYRQIYTALFHPLTYQSRPFRTRLFIQHNCSNLQIYKRDTSRLRQINRTLHVFGNAFELTPRS